MTPSLRRFRRWIDEGPTLTQRRFLAAFAVLFALVTISLIGEGLLAGANRTRINEIQASRVASCEQTYGAFLEVFRPFFPTHAKDWTPKQRGDWRKLTDTVDRLKARCIQQTRALDAAHHPRT